MLLSFVIPCYGSEKTIATVIEEIISKVNERQEYDYEIITVNDCSPDNVIDILRELSAKNEKIKVIDLAKNFGKHSAVMAAYCVAQGDIIVNLDDDGQCPINMLWDLLEPLRNYDAAYAKYSKKMQSKFKNLGSKLNSIMAQYMINKPKELCTSNFSAFRRFVVQAMLLYKNPYPYIPGLVLRTTSKITNVDMEERKRIEGNGNYTLKRSLSLWFNGFTAFSVKPLRVAAVFGFICAMAGILIGIAVIIRKLLNPSILMGYSSTMSVLLFISGIIMLILGLIGEYVGRIYICINSSPQYIIRSTVNLDDSIQKDESFHVV